MMDEGEGTGSKMDTHNLATVISPNILKGKSQIIGQDEESFLGIEVINTLIEYNDEMCEVSPLHSQLFAQFVNHRLRSQRIFNPS